MTDPNDAPWYTGAADKTIQVQLTKAEYDHAVRTGVVIKDGVEIGFLRHSGSPTDAWAELRLMVRTLREAALDELAVVVGWLFKAKW